MTLKFKNMTQNEIILNRYSNENCYLYGTIYDNEEYVCDTLEFGSEIAIPTGRYELIIGKSEDNYTTVVKALDELGGHVCDFLTDTTYMYRNIKLRQETRNICVGAKCVNPLLVMCEYSARLLKLKVLNYTNRGEKCYLLVKWGKNML